ncbi:MAG: hypothetical protein JXB49_19200 [Bacteroidales bacterium]|nr:hypothetical protein [Bacteroidales bacterium]
MCTMYENYRSASTFGKVMRIVGLAILGVVGAAGFAILFGYIVMMLWNWLMPALFNLPIINFWHAVGVIILARLIFGGFKHGSHHYPRPPRYSKYWKHHYEKRCVNGFHWSDWKYYDKFWKEEGEQAFSDYLKQKKESSGE